MTDRATRAVVVLIVAGVAARLVLAATIGLGVDESYAVTVSRTISLSYFDHPPLSFWLAGGAARLAGSEQASVVRLPFILLFAATTWVMYRLTALLFTRPAGLWAAVLLNLSLVFSVSTGGWVLPDGPLMCFMLATVYCLARVLFLEGGAPGGEGWWLLAGVCTGLALLSKYHGVFLVAGTFLFLLTSPGHRAWLRRPEPWLAAAVAAVLFMPVVIWNGEHDWVSFRFQGARGVPDGDWHVGSLVRSIGAQALYVLPWIWLPLVAALARGARAGPRESRSWLLCCLAAGPIVTFTLPALGGNPGLPHWEAPGYLMLFPLLGAGVASRLDGSAVTRGWLVASTIAFLLLVPAAATQIATGWLSRAAPSLFARGDPSLEALDWRDLGPALRARGLSEADRFVAASNWIDAGKLAYALGPSVPVLCLCDAPHHFAFLRPLSGFRGRDAILVAPAGPRGDSLAFVPWFRTIRREGVVPIRRGDRVALELNVYRGDDFRPRDAEPAR